MPSRFEVGEWVRRGAEVGWIDQILNYNVMVQFVGNSYTSSASPDSLESYDAILPEAVEDAKPVFVEMAISTWDEDLFNYAIGKTEELT
ncbi:hypothetical protein D5F11_021575 [Siminovitchia terrae]|uniref:Uncharacterized protein n=1 Tax=Siminovitchia terrae TaxID=1914933 RepID=A0A429X2K5_SIMTE|nr:hypothetical protein [Siminovitchia terrae]RST57653.1 hypothetical protein D5F11_021575 [Siminovitchia terrae]